VRAVPSSRRKRGSERPGSPGESSPKGAARRAGGRPGGEPEAEAEPEILDGLARDIVSRLASTLFAEDEEPLRPLDEVSAAEAEAGVGAGGGEKAAADTGRGVTPAGGWGGASGLQWGVVLTPGRPASLGSSRAAGLGPGLRSAGPGWAAGRGTRRESAFPGERPALLVRGTVRSGRQVRHNGDVVVLGDVNPGGQVVAAGDVIVMGTLRGMVHAGATGDHTAVVAAFRLRPTQLRIASYVARPPEEPGGYPDYPELAMVREGVVVVRPLVGSVPTRSGTDETVPGQPPAGADGDR